MTEERKRDRLLELVKAGQKTLPPGYELKSKSRFTVGDLSYTVCVCFVDLTVIVSGVNLHSYSESDTLVKYSEARYSPVSSKPADYIRLATSSYYRNLETGENSELIADSLESAHREALDWRNENIAWLETLKKNLATSLSASINNVKVETTQACDDFWMYCASIDPDLHYYRSKQIESLSSSYDFMTKIAEPSKFAEQLGCDVGKQIELQRDFKVDWPIEALVASKLGVNDYFISVYHGPVFYLNAGEKQKLIQRYELGSRNIIPFVKSEEYREQQEYRFLVRVSGYSPNEDLFYLKVSDELRNLMSPI